MKIIASILCMWMLTASASIVSNKVVMIDQDGNINAPEVIASVADMATNKVEIAIAKASAQAAEIAARQGTNIVAETVQKIVENEFVVYRYGNTDSLGVLVTLPENTKVKVSKFTPNVATDGNGNVQHEIVYATTEDASLVAPAIKHANVLKNGTEFTILDTTVEFSQVDGAWEDLDGNVFNYQYSAKFWMPASTEGYYIVYLDADAADGNGMTFNVTGGITGGATESVKVGSDILVFKGGLLMEVKSNE